MGLLSSLEECSYTRVISIRQRKFRPKMDSEERKQLKKPRKCMNSLCCAQPRSRRWTQISMISFGEP